MKGSGEMNDGGTGAMTIITTEGSFFLGLHRGDALAKPHQPLCFFRDVGKIEPHSGVSSSIKGRFTQHHFDLTSKGGYNVGPPR